MHREDIEYLKKIYKTDKAQYLFHVELVNANIPLQYRHLEFDDLDHPQLEASKKKLLNYLDTLVKKGLFDSKIRGKGFYIYGSSGSAKTVLACVLAKEIIRKTKYSVFFIPFVDLAESIRSNESVDWLIQYNFLIIDDFGNYQYPTFVTDKFVSFIKKRFFRGNPTILTSLLSPQQIGSLFGNSMYSFALECFNILDHSRMIDWRKK